VLSVRKPDEADLFQSRALEIEKKSDWAGLNSHKHRRSAQSPFQSRPFPSSMCRISLNGKLAGIDQRACLSRPVASTSRTREPGGVERGLGRSADVW